MMIDIRMPSLKEGMESGILCEWTIDAGDAVKRGDVIAEIEVDKVTSRIEAAYDMKIIELCAEEGDEVKVGTVIARAESDEH